MHKLLIVVVLFHLAACQHPAVKKAQSEPLVIADSIPVKQDTTLLFFDSLQLNLYLNQHSEFNEQQKKLSEFYQTRNYAFAWINNYGFNEYARNFLNILNNEVTINRNDSSFYQNKLHTLYNMLSEDGQQFDSKDSLVRESEFLFTVNFFEYAKRNYVGMSDEQLKKVNWFIERKKINYESLLDTILKSPGNSIAENEPVYRQFGLLKRLLQKYIDIEKNGGWIPVLTETNSLKKGDTSAIISSIKKQLFVLGDLAKNDSTDLFNDAFENAIKNFQNRHGLKDDGIIKGKTVQQLNVSVHERIQQILINMERSKWVPVEMKGDYLAVNIPEFKLHVYHDDSLEWSCNVIVGKAKMINNTAIFNDDLQYIVFSPYWNIPRSILIKETLPAIKRNSNYLSKHNMEVVTSSGEHIASSSIDWKKYGSNFPYTIRQKPGKNNSLGLVKFLFPNSYEIYIHDTPQKSLFGETTRTFSHGCIRLHEPFHLAQYLLRNDSNYTDAKINALMNGGKQTYVKLKKKVPVFIAYFTAWVDRSGKLNFREDIYHHDERMKQMLFVN